MINAKVIMWHQNKSANVFTQNYSPLPGKQLFLIGRGLKQKNASPAAGWF